MNSDHFVREIHAAVAKLPQLPATVTKILAICNDPSSSPAQLNRAVSLDPVLTAKVLKLINSVYYGMHHQITSLVRAVVLLGMNTVKNLALSSAVLSQLRGRQYFGALDPDEFWRHCVAVGAVCRMIAKSRGISNNQIEEYFIIGLLHDLGKIPLNSRFADEYHQLIDRQVDGQGTLYVLETSCFGLDHAAVGSMILGRWHLRPEVVGAVAAHHFKVPSDTAHQDLIYTVKAADNFVNQCGVGHSGARAVSGGQHEIHSALGLDVGFFEGRQEHLLQEIDNAMVFLEMI